MSANMRRIWFFLPSCKVTRKRELGPASGRELIPFSSGELVPASLLPPRSMRSIVQGKVRWPSD